MQKCTLTALSTLVKCDNDTVIDLAYVELPTGFEWIVVDNLGLASASNPIMVIAAFPGGFSEQPIANPGGLLRMTWTGAFYALG